MSRYAFTFKKDDMFVEFVTSDKDLVERQFQIWVSDADDYVNGRLKKNYNIASQFKAESFAKPDPAQPAEEELKIEPSVAGPEQVAAPTIEQEINVEEASNAVQETVQEIQTAQVQEESMPQVEPQVEQIQESPVTAVPAQEEIVSANEAEVTDFVQFEINKESEIQEQTIEPQVQPAEPEVFDQASTLLKTINTIQNPPQEEAPTVNFEAVLDKSIENPTFEPARAKDPVFLNLLQSKKTDDKFNFLIITAYYLSEFEKMERFSLKQINAKLMQNVSVVIEHPILQDAINKNLLEVIPDLTGVAEVAEYRLTRAGEEFFANII